MKEELFINWTIDPLFRGCLVRIFDPWPTISDEVSYFSGLRVLMARWATLDRGLLPVLAPRHFRTGAILCCSRAENCDATSRFPKLLPGSLGLGAGWNATLLFDCDSLPKFIPGR